MSIVAYNGISRNARTVSIQSTITQLQKKIELYKAQNGEYPVTTSVTPLASSTGHGWADSNCSAVTSSSERRTDWIPGLDITLPQSDGSITGAQGHRGYYLYVINGTEYILSAWNLLPGPATGSRHRRANWGLRSHERLLQVLLHCFERNQLQRNTSGRCITNPSLETRSHICYTKIL